ncbi:MAG: hypothetical protein A2537_01015 [Candidatus Magasanikbacteria bacterium RIFOXYD2_FULL_36_9]|uniref:Uncharacterized protein n=1 Tax=Candidatus Magasanikbacteria bacterium RIFOXYD2_FULL_36_9 TaxID=1798707 RepID=A0A1F6P226_9BACT|nr:MAG: hypothetical protein A2537_01015 [Candidatus Magasanikbacteria bacterium RIFOXYD2_FULL_36_9]
MFTDSKDVLYLVISFCVVWVTFFLCWMFYYLMRLLRNANQIVEEFRVRLQALTEAINYIRGKVEHMSGLLTLVTDGASGLLQKVIAKKTNEWVNTGSDKINKTAKDAVAKAVAETAKKMKKVTKSIKK